MYHFDGEYEQRECCIPGCRQVEIQTGDCKSESIVTVWAIDKHDCQLICHLRKGQRTLRLPKCYSYFMAVCECYLAIFTDKANVVAINPLTTVASVFCFSRILKIKGNQAWVKGTCQQLQIADGFKQSFVKHNGKVSPAIQNNPNGLETNSYPMFNYLANLVFYSKTERSVRDTFLSLTGTKSILEALHHVAIHPFNKVTEIYDLIKNLDPVYTPALNTVTLPAWKSSPPLDQWTLTVKVNKSGANHFLIGGPGYLVFDKCGRAWLTNNARQGTANSSTFCTILEPNGQPSSFSPLFGGGLLGAGFGIATNCSHNKIAIGNFGWGPTDYNPQEGSISLFTAKGGVLSPPNGFTNGFRRAQGLAYDHQDNLWISVWGDQAPLGGGDPPTFEFPSGKSGVTVYFKGNPNNLAVYEFDNQYYHTFDVVVDEIGNAYVSNAGDGSQGVNSSVYHFQLHDRQLMPINSWTSDQAEGFRQVNISPKGTVMVAAVITHRVLLFDKNLSPLGQFSNQTDGPWGIAFDQAGTTFVANFRGNTGLTAHPDTSDMSGRFGVTVIYNEDDSTAKLATLPTGGSPVVLANGFPLYGSNGKPGYEPLMRLTGSRTDSLGNLWVVNNWKPALLTDFKSNPPGDGVVIFIGLGRATT